MSSINKILNKTKKKHITRNKFGQTRHHHHIHNSQWCHLKSVYQSRNIRAYINNTSKPTSVLSCVVPWLGCPTSLNLAFIYCAVAPKKKTILMIHLVFFPTAQNLTTHKIYIRILSSGVV